MNTNGSIIKQFQPKGTTTSKVVEYTLDGLEHVLKYVCLSEA
jgi:hypothetical protein